MTIVFTLYGAFIAKTGYSNPLGVSSYGLPDNQLTNATNEAIISYMASVPGQWRSMALLTRGHYAYKSRYIFGFSMRRDGSTKFGENSKFGNFPGVSGKWIISDEDFMIPTRHFMSMAAIRASWGVSGGQPPKEYLHYSRYATLGNYSSIPVIVPSTLAIDDLKWEKTTSINIGTDLGFFDDKLVFDINMYRGVTEDLLFPNIALPSTSGFASVSYVNGGTMENLGWEFNMNANNVIKTKDLAIDFSLNFANNRNKLIALNDDILESYNGEFNYSAANGQYLTRVEEGSSYGSVYGFKSQGVYKYDEYTEGMDPNMAPVAVDENGNLVTDSKGDPVPMMFGYGITGVSDYEFRGGDAKYEDRNHDGSIDELDITYLGNSNPKLNGGFGTVLRYKNLSVSAFFNFRLGNKIINSARMYLENMYYDDNQSVAVNYRWRKDGDETIIPRALYLTGYNWLGSDRFIEDGSFLRFKYLTFRYNMPKSRLEKVGIKQLSVYATINNVAVFTRYTGVDPEVGYGSLGITTDNARTPRSKDATLGITLTF